MSAGNLMGVLNRALQRPIAKLLQDFDSLVQVRRPVTQRAADNTQEVTGWQDIANGSSVGAKIAIEETTADPDIGESSPVRRAEMLISGVCAPRVDDGVRVVEGTYAGQTFRVTSARATGEIVWRCELRATVETFD